MNEQERQTALNCPVFRDMPPNEATALIDGGHTSAYAAGRVILGQGERVQALRVLLRGEAEAAAQEPTGRRVIMARIAEGGVFGDALAAARSRLSPVSVEAITDCRVLRLDFARLIENAAAARNLLGVFSDKYFDLQERVNCLIQPTLRGKILQYLSKHGAGTFNIPFDRAALADYLNADRSALCRELSAMKRAGLIDYYKNSFRLLTPGSLRTRQAIRGGQGLP